MARFVALLRGVNVGGNRKVPMAGLRAMCVELGFRDPQTVIQSGNLVFEGTGVEAAIGRRLESAVHEKFGFYVPVVVREASRWHALVGSNPFLPQAEKDPAKVQLGLSLEPPAPGAAEALQARATQGEQVEVAGDAVWIHFAGGVGSSKLTPDAIDAAVGSPTTLRNWTTVQKLAELVR